MPIDDYGFARSLTNQLSESVPFKVRPGKELLKLMKRKGKPMSTERDYFVEHVMSSGDEGGITCMLQGSPTDTEVVGSSITHLIIDPEHPLAEQVKMYQRQRTRRLMIENRQGFAALASSTKSAKKKKKRGGGFG